MCIQGFYWVGFDLLLVRVIVETHPNTPLFRSFRQEIETHDDT